mmetsp:Transcript_58870/g.188084  ORF Transcript_58870/g.188084 Transcript_58870/m.188084 type:complete len:358 (+) Transcript_58870:926-1999(+)
MERDVEGDGARAALRHILEELRLVVEALELERIHPLALLLAHQRARVHLLGQLGVVIDDHAHQQVDPEKGPKEHKQEHVHGHPRLLVHLRHAVDPHSVHALVAYNHPVVQSGHHEEREDRVPHVIEVEIHSVPAAFHNGPDLAQVPLGAEERPRRALPDPRHLDANCPRCGVDVVVVVDVVAPIKLPPEELHPQDPEHPKLKEPKGNDIEHLGKGSDERLHHDLHPLQPGDHPQRTQGAHETQGPQDLQRGPAHKEVDARGDDDDEVQDVPARTEVAPRVHGEAHADDLDAHLKEERHREDLVDVVEEIPLEAIGADPRAVDCKQDRVDDDEEEDNVLELLRSRNLDRELADGVPGA